MKVEFPVFHVWNYRDTLHTWRKTFLYFMYENMGGYFIHACRISYISCMKIWVCAFVEWIPLLLFFQEKKQHFTLTSNDTNSYNFVLVNHEFHLDLQGNSSQTSVCFRITWRACELKLSDGSSRALDLVDLQIPVQGPEWKSLCLLHNAFKDLK